MNKKELVEIELKIITSIFNEQKCIEAMAVFVKGDDHAMMPLSMEDDEEKDIMSTAIRAVTKHLEPDAVIFISEAWATTVREYNIASNVRPSNYPDRVETVMVLVEFKTGEKYSCSANIIRNGTPRLSKFTISQADQNMGRFSGFFPPDPKSVQ
jgi:hypothetical protein